MISTMTLSMMQRAGFIPAFCVLALLSHTASAQSQQTQTPPAPKRDSAFAERTVVRSDSLPTPFVWYGALARRSTDTLLDVTKFDRRTKQYQNTSDLLIRATPMLSLSHGGFSQHNAISMAGGWNADMAISVNGRSVVDPWSGQFQLSQLAPEAYERFEILTGTHAVGLAASSALTAINAQEMRFNTATPYTSLWYSQGGGDVIAADVGIAQNIAPGVNVNLGVRRSGGNGRYPNQDYDVWNVRANTHIALDNLTNLRFSYNLTSQNTGLSGGLRTIVPLDQLTEATSPPVFFYLQDEMRRHDVTMSGTHLFDSVGTHEVSAQVYLSSTDMLRIRDSTLYTSPTDRNDLLIFHARQVGVLVRSRHQLDVIDLRLGAGVDVFTMDSTVYNQSTNEAQPQVFGHVDVPFGTTLFSGAARIALVNGTLLTSAGAGLTFDLHGSLLRADVSTTQRAPSATEGLALTPERHLLGLIEWRARLGLVDLLAQGFYRNVSNMIITTSDRDSLQLIRSTTSVNGASTSVAGVVAQATFENTWLEFRPVVRLHVTPAATDATRPLPLLSAELSAAYVYRVGSNSVRLGAKASLVSPMASQQYVPITWTYIAPVTSQGWVGNGLDVYLTAILGDASVRISYENILGERWYSTAIAPEIIRDLRISITWSFFD